MRLDLYLTKNDFYPSREKAHNAIKKGIVLVNDKIVEKPSIEVDDTDRITITEQLLPYVSWGGMKLERAIQYFKLDFYNKKVLDIGASTGGFTDCALAFGASEVYAVDVGSNQLHNKLKNDSRVKSFEQTNIIDFTADCSFDFLVMDVSFVSIKKIIPSLIRFLNSTNALICLIKPQFELGKTKFKNGVVKDPKVHLQVINDVIAFIRSLGLYVNNLTYSTQKGKTGNIEYLAYISKNDKIENYQIEEVVALSHKM